MKNIKRKRVEGMTKRRKLRKVIGIERNSEKDRIANDGGKGTSVQ